jgi:hypothetical protein
MELWNIRNQAQEDLDGRFRDENETLLDTFALVDKCIQRLFTVGEKENDRFALVCCHTLIKARRYALGCYSLCIDGLAQEAGALLRPFIETWEQLIFYHQEPKRVELALENKLPQAGKIAQKIGSELQGLRDYLNKNASHFSFEPDTLQPMATTYDSENLKTNIRVLFTTLCMTAGEAAECLSALGRLDNELAGDILRCREKGLQIFKIDEPGQGN